MELRKLDKSQLVEKPWGYEIRFAITDKYLGKLIHVNKGEMLSLQYHVRKDESLMVVNGVMELELEADDGTMMRKVLEPGESVRIFPGRKHRMKAIEDLDFFEVSTPDIDDVVRLEDKYGRV